MSDNQKMTIAKPVNEFDRDFLNEPDTDEEVTEHNDARGPGGTAIIHWQVNSNGAMKNYASVDGNLTLSDCGRLITLDFGFYDPKSHQKAMRKMDRLLDHLNRMREAMRSIEWVPLPDKKESE